MRLLPSCWWRLAFAAVVSGLVMQAPARAEAAAPAAPTQASDPAPTTVPEAAPAKKSWRNRIGDLAAKLTPGHSSRAKEPRLSKPGPVKRHAPDSAPAAEAKASLRTKQFGAALQELLTAAEHGDVQSQYLLGLVYASGVGPELSLPEARRWLEAAADKSNPEAALALSGLLVEQDRAAAQLWLSRYWD